MKLSWNRILSGLLAVIYVICGFALGGSEAGFRTFIFAILPLACIWFSETMGGYVGPVWRAVITDPSPAIFACIAGWLLLLLPLVVALVYAFTRT
jgi:hypothetical protein